MLKFIIVSDIHITQYDGFNKQSNISERSLLILKNFINIKKNLEDDSILIVVGDWFDNINKIHSIDLQITNMIFNLFKKVIFINGNHDIYTQSNNNFEITSGNILSTNKKVVYFNEPKLINMNDNYFWFFPYNSVNVNQFITKELQNLFNSNKYTNKSKHYFFSHLPIKEIENQFQNINDEYFSYSEFLSLMNKYKIDYQFFQGHYHLKSTEKIINDKRFHIITTFPKNFSDKVTSINDFKNFGYYELDLNTNEFYFNPMNEYFIFYEMLYSEDNVNKLIEFLSNNKNYFVNLKLVINKLNEQNLILIEKLKSVVKKIQIVNQFISENQNENNENDVESNTFEIVNVYVYLINYIKSIINITDEYKNNIVEYLNKLKEEIKQLKDGD